MSGPKAHAAALKRPRRVNEALARKRRAAANFRKAKRRLARMHRRLAAIRRDATHKLTTRIGKTDAVIGIEDLNLRGSMRNRHLTRAVSDGGFHEFRRPITYKARLHGARVVTAGRFYPSVKTCSCCGVVKPALDLAERTFGCDDCGFEAGRDVNAALNLARLAPSSAVTACGEPRSDVRRKPRVKRGPVKQEDRSDLKDAA